MIRKNLGFDLLEQIISNLGEVEYAYVVGDYANGKDTGIIDLVIVGDINRNYLNELIVAAEENLKRKIRPLVLSIDEFANLKQTLKLDKGLLIWKK